MRFYSEVFDNPYQFYWKDRGWAQFSTEDGRGVSVVFLGEVLVRVSFTVEGSTGLSGLRDEFRIFSTVLAAIMEYDKNSEHVSEYHISAGQKRLRLYERIARRVAPEFDVKAVPGYMYLTRKR